MLHALLTLLLCGGQADDTVLRADPNRTAYQGAVDLCGEVEKILVANPDAALEKLAPLFADSIDKGRFKLIERRIFIEVKSQESRPHDFYPYHLRGRARLLAAQKRKDEEARRLLIDAAADLQASVARGAAQSREPLASAQRELWENARAAISYDGWSASRSSLVDQAIVALSGSDVAREAADWARKEIGRVEAMLRELRKEPIESDRRKTESRLAVDWCAAVAAAFKEPASAARVGALAAAIRDSRGRFRLKIAVSPWAKVTRLERDGEVIELADRDTPLVVPQELEIDDYRIELTSPKGRKDARISAKSLEPGKTYVLWGDMSGDKFPLAELPK